MKDLLEEFWYGNLLPQDQCPSFNREVKKINSFIVAHYDKLMADLSDEQKKTLEKYDDCIHEMYGITEKEIFIYAFRLGGRFMLATLSDEQVLPTDSTST
ncbi:MAG: hypothetical protein E7531_01445 [Ruminococcaceae bacterium]|nr:hypothetical protein [Oscillospiraceae bacterium]